MNKLETLLTEVEGWKTDLGELTQLAKEDSTWAASRLVHERKQARELAGVVRRQRECLRRISRGGPEQSIESYVDQILNETARLERVREPNA